MVSTAKELILSGQNYHFPGQGTHIQDLGAINMCVKKHRIFIKCMMN